MKKVVLRLAGGLGNQLFMYATARRLAVHNNAELIVDHVSGFEHDTLYQRVYELNKLSINILAANGSEMLEPFQRLRRCIMRNINKVIPFYFRNYIYQPTNIYEPRLLDFKVKRTVYLDGYWQSYRYFDDIRPALLSEIKFDIPQDNLVADLLIRIKNSNSVAIHIRQFDIHSKSLDNNLGYDYYQKAIRYIESNILDPHFYIFSDGDFSPENINLNQSNSTFVKSITPNNQAHIDMWLMTNCKHFIIANSTFSWWAAWLSTFNNKIVIQPTFKDKLGSKVNNWDYDELSPSEWIRL